MKKVGKQCRKGKKPRNKTYHPRAVDRFAAGNLIVQKSLDASIHKMMNAPLNDETQTDTNVAYQQAMNSMADGTGTEENWSTLVFVINMSYVLSEHSIGADYRDKMIEALDAVFRAKLRADRSGKWGFDGAGLQAVQLALEVNEAQMEIATQAEFERAIAEVHRRIETGVVYEAGIA